MNTLSRKQREILAREKLFLKTARDLIRADGVSGLTMERIADVTEYSKGTVYKHFTCKEDLLCALCGEALGYMLHLSSAMQHFEGSPRERLMIVALAYQTFIEKFPEEFDLFLSARSNNIRSKASHKRLAEVDEIDSTLMALVADQIKQALETGDLVLEDNLTVDDLCFGPWALSFGILSIYQGRELVRSISLPEINESLFRHLNALLDGYQWRPLSHQHDYRNTMERAWQQLGPFLTNWLNSEDISHV